MNGRMGRNTRRAYDDGYRCGWTADSGGKPICKYQQQAPKDAFDRGFAEAQRQKQKAELALARQTRFA